VIDEGTPELVNACRTGKVPVDVGAKLAREAPEKQLRVVENVTTGKAKNAREAMRAERLTERHERNAVISVENAERLPKDRRYSVIYADPPWQYEHAISTSREIEEQYPTLDTDDIGKIQVDGVPVVRRAADDCVLFLWAPPSLVEHGLRVLRAWGFEYRTMIVWDKEKVGMGYWVRQQAELVLIGVKGNPPTPKPADRPSSVFRAPRGKHSAKPEQFYDVIEAMYPGAARLEMFKRGVARKGWDVWGNQAQV
jgi:N6-adenosine-specific RNA methylase IME4